MTVEALDRRAVAALRLRSRAAVVCGAAAVLAMGWYVGNIGRLLVTRRLPADWSLRHVVAAHGHLAAGAICGLALLTAVDPGSEAGSRLSAIYGMLLLGGWISNYIVGMGTRMMPGLMRRGAQPLLPATARAAVFVLLNGGVAIAVAGLATAHVTMLRTGALASALASLVFTTGLVRSGGWRE